MNEENTPVEDLPPSWIVELRQHLAEPAPGRLTSSDAREAAVLVPLFVDAGALWVLLTRRAEELSHHPGQVAFPGGVRETGESAWETALREAREELGLQEAAVLRLGHLDEVESPAGFRIVPCVGAIPAEFEPQPDEVEVVEAFQIPVTAFADPRLVEERQMTFDGQERDIRFYHIGGRQIWGLTARIVHNLMARLGLDGG